MSVPVTARLDESVVEALDRAVDAGVVASRGSAVAAAVREWLDRHGEEAIAESYRRRYETPDAEADDLIAAPCDVLCCCMPRRRRDLIARGDIWDAAIPGVGTHPIVVATRDTAIPVLTSLVCVLVTSTFRGHVAEVAVGRDEGLRSESAANCDNLFTLPKSVLSRRRGRLGAAKLVEFDRALTIALGLD